MDELIAKFLEPMKANLAVHYQWTFDLNIPRERFGIVIEKSDWLERTLSLKSQLADIVRERRQSRPDLRDVANYFIRVWGGIARFDRADDIIERFQEIMGTDTAAYDRPFIFDGVSSWSKWLSLACPQWACIYDARVAYSLNAINFIGGGKYPIFLSPEGRNSRLKILDVSTLLLARQLTPDVPHDPESLREAYFISRSDAYPQYLSLVNRVSHHLWDDEDHIHDVEMLLFALADTAIYEKTVEHCQEIRHATVVE